MVYVEPRITLFQYIMYITLQNFDTPDSKHITQYMMDNVPQDHFILIIEKLRFGKRTTVR